MSLEPDPLSITSVVEADNGVILSASVFVLLIVCSEYPFTEESIRNNIKQQKILTSTNKATQTKFIVSQARPHDKIASRLLFFLSRDDT